MHRVWTFSLNWGSSLDRSMIVCVPSLFCTTGLLGNATPPRLLTVAAVDGIADAAAAAFNDDGSAGQDGK